MARKKAVFGKPFVIRKRKGTRKNRPSYKKLFKVQDAMVKDLEQRLEESKQEVKKLEKQLKERVAPRKVTWTTAEGDIMTLDQMEDRHLQNTIFYLFRRLRSGFDSARYLEGMQRQIQSLSDMLHEASRRGLRV